MAWNMGWQLFAFKFVVLAIVFLSLMPPFSFAYLTLGVVGVFSATKGMVSVRNKNGEVIYWAVLAILPLSILAIAVL